MGGIIAAWTCRRLRLRHHRRRRKCDLQFRWCIPQVTRFHRACWQIRISFLLHDCRLTANFFVKWFDRERSSSSRDYWKKRSSEILCSRSMLRVTGAVPSITIFVSRAISMRKLFRLTCVTLMIHLNYCWCPQLEWRMTVADRPTHANQIRKRILRTVWKKTVSISPRYTRWRGESLFWKLASIENRSEAIDHWMLLVLPASTTVLCS